MGIGKPAAWRTLSRIFLSLGILGLFAIFVLSWLFRSDANFLLLPKNLVILAPAEAQGTLTPLIEARKKQGFEVFFLPSSEGICASPSDGKCASLPFSSGYALLVGSPFVPPASPFYLPSTLTVKKRVYTRQKLGTLFPVGNVDIQMTSDLTWTQTHLGSFTPGRFPVRTMEELRMVVTKTLEYDTRFRGKKGRRLFFFGESPHFSDFIDTVIEGFMDLITRNNLPRHLTGTKFMVHQKGAWAGQVLGHLNQGPDIVAYGGHGNANTLGSLLNSGDLLASPPQTVCGPFFIFACQTGFQGPEDIASHLIINPHGPSHVLFSSGFSHPYSDALLSFSLGGLIRQGRDEPMGAYLFSGAANTREPGAFMSFVNWLAWALVQLTPDDLFQLREDVGVIHNLFGDPSQIVYFK